MILEALVAAHIATAAATTVLYIDSNAKQQTINTLTEQLNSNSKQLKMLSSSKSTNQQDLMLILNRSK